MPAGGGKRRQRRAVEPDPAFSPERLAELWGNAETAVADDEEGEQ